jgi:hypothetical protein
MNQINVDLARGFWRRPASGEFKVVNGNFVFEYDYFKGCFRINKNPFYEMEDAYLDIGNFAISPDCRIFEFEIKSRNSKYRIFTESKIGHLQKLLAKSALS